MVKQVITYVFLISAFMSLAQEVKVERVTTKLKGNVYGPAYFRDLLVVCSDQKDHFLKTVLDVRNNRTTDIYMLMDTLGNYQRFDETFRTDLNDGPVTFDKNGEHMVISMNIDRNLKLTKQYNTVNPFGLFESSINATGWTTPKLLPFVNPQYEYMHPGLNENGDVLVFTSNQPGGYGGFDIWISMLKDGKWSEPKNAGPDVNTKSNEVFPSVSNQVIYFSSDRNSNVGLDIYSYEPNKGRITHLKAPFNSEHDDFGYVQRSGYEEGYFTSNRGGKDEVWRFKITETEPEIDCRELVPNTLCYTLSEENATELGEIGALVYEWHINDSTLQGISIDYCFPGEGAYEITLDIIDTIINETYYNQSYYYLEILFDEQPYISCEDTVLVNEKFSISAEKTNLPGVEIKEYIWTISDGTNVKSKKLEHTLSEPGIYTVELMVNGVRLDSSFSDCVYKTVECLSQEMVSNLTKQNILDDSSKVIEEQFYYQEESDSSNLVYSIEVVRTDEKLDHDNFLFKLMETYGEVKIHFIEEKNQYSYLIGEWKSLGEAHPTWRELIRKGYDEAIVRSIDLNKISKFQLDNSFVLDNVRFDEGKWNIRPDAVPDLQNIVEIMLIFPDVELLIQAHTDSDGPEEFNLELSGKRAQAVKGYIVSKGIDPERIQAEGYGESQPKASNETEEGKEVNRRVEFTFVK